MTGKTPFRSKETKKQGHDTFQQCDSRENSNCIDLVTPVKVPKPNTEAKFKTVQRSAILHDEILGRNEQPPPTDCESHFTNTDKSNGRYLTTMKHESKQKKGSETKLLTPLSLVERKRKSTGSCQSLAFGKRKFNIFTLSPDLKDDSNKHDNRQVLPHLFH